MAQSQSSPDTASPLTSLQARVIDRVQSLAESELLQLEALMGEHFRQDAAHSDEFAVNFLERNGLTEDELVRIADEGHAAILRGEGSTLDEVRRDILSKYLD